MIRIVEETFADVGAREALLDRAYGDSRFAKVSEILRRGYRPAEGLALIAMDGEDVIGTVRLWNVAAGGVEMLLLGPLAVDPARQSEGIGAALMRHAITRARALGHGAIILVGDAAYYGRFGFSTGLTWRLSMPGRVDSERFLALELRKGALSKAAGEIVASGRPAVEADVIPFVMAGAPRRSRGGLRLRAA
ncbi:N-acetyltransferase [Terrarubrum flagellatum]|uniref:GNAT family N-acetyltransferase n=1 Tax=Terrirubrum flagellatum TaxID=2895980 RepID=UPI00314550E6